MKRSQRLRRLAVTVLAALVFLDAGVWYRVYGALAPGALEMHFLDVGQGDSQLILLPAPGGRGASVSVLIDGGNPNGLAVAELAKLLPAGSRRIDLVIMTHPQLDHFGGFIEVLATYDVGAFVGTGRTGTSGAYGELQKAILDKQVPYVRVGAGDRIRYRDSALAVLAPTPQQLVSDELNDTAIVALLTHGGVRALFTGDIGAREEKDLAGAGANIRAQVLKVAHHGSRFSSTAAFLEAVQPAVAVIGVGAKNTYGHPTAQTLARLGAVGAQVLRTDVNGTVSMVRANDSLLVFTRR